jgi:hypothetical protein
MKYPIDKLEKTILLIVNESLKSFEEKTRYVPATFNPIFFVHKSLEIDVEYYELLFKNMYNDPLCILERDDYFIKLGFTPINYAQQDRRKKIIELRVKSIIPSGQLIEILLDQDDYLQWVLDYKLSKL